MRKSSAPALSHRPSLTDQVDESSANAVLDLIELEAANHARCKAKALHATTASERISWLSAALESAHGAAEMAGRLREFHPDAADRIINRWRDEAANLAVRRHEVVENPKAELIV